ncbi:MAG: substrate-binding domain-containing protein [Magnetococcales bacterium]|nr:substrate-binding domain-containing protein [Magnetococcales bacterium]
MLLCASAGVAAEPPRIAPLSETTEKQLAYLVSDLRIPFWQIMARGIETGSVRHGYKTTIRSADNDPGKELEHTMQAIRDGVAGLIVSPTNSSACVTILKLAERANIPVVIADIGADRGEYVTYISSDNFTGAYGLGQLLVKRMREMGWENGTVGIVSIPQKRENGQARTAGFMKALDEAGIRGAGMMQQVDFSYQETYVYSKTLIATQPQMRALWLQGSNRYQGALDAMADANRKGEILLITFDAEPEFIDMIPKKLIVGAGMQQPFLMGEEAVRHMDRHLSGQPVSKVVHLPVLVVSDSNINTLLPVIRRNVLGLIAP